MVAARKGHAKVVSDLIEAGADISLTDVEQWSALHWAASKGHVSTVSVLLAKGADMEMRDVDG